MQNKVLSAHSASAVAIDNERRGVLAKVAAATGSLFLLPTLVACAKKDELAENDFPSTATAAQSGTQIPISRPANFNPIQFNLDRGLAGAIPSAYHASITGVDGPLVHIGKHMAYIAPIDRAMVPSGYVALMMGEFAKGYTRHGATATHWYDWIAIRKEGSAYGTIITSSFPAWPSVTDNMVFGGGLITDAAGINTVYLARLPADVKAGDTLCVMAHCNIHGEYVSYITV